MCLVLSGSVRHFDVALLWQFTNHDFALTVRYRSFILLHMILYCCQYYDWLNKEIWRSQCVAARPVTLLAINFDK